MKDFVGLFYFPRNIYECEGNSTKLFLLASSFSHNVTCLLSYSYNIDMGPILNSTFLRPYRVSKMHDAYKCVNAKQNVLVSVYFRGKNDFHKRKGLHSLCWNLLNNFSIYCVYKSKQFAITLKVQRVFVSIS